MPQFIEIQVSNERFARMGGGDPIKQREERSAALREIAEKAEKGGYEYSDNWSPFPKWLRDIIKSMADANRTKAKYDDENSVYKMRIAGDRLDFDDFYAEFKKRTGEFIATDEEAQKWNADNRIHVTATADDEMGAMNDLELYQRNSAALPPSRAPQGDSK